ncbi:MAG: TerB family tellurite resistance protein [Bacteroidales bacterium]|nr:TerB family tellurite resistance protein [Bacteroidales bacterium]
MQEEFMIMLMLYAANIDGKIKPDELKVVLEKFDALKVVEVRQKFNKMNDDEVLNFIVNQKDSILDSQEKKSAMMMELRRIIESDGKKLPIEELLLCEMERLLQQRF